MKNTKILLGIVLLCPAFASAQNEISMKPHKLQLGTFAETQKEFQKNIYYIHNNTLGINCGIAARYRLSNTFTIASGIGASVSFYNYESTPLFYDIYEPAQLEKVEGKTTKYTLRFPVTVQTNLYKKKLFISTGVELFKDIHSKTNSTFTDINTQKTRAVSSTYNGGSVDAQFIAGFGYNFNAFKGNVFSLDANLKMYYILTGYHASIARNIYTPSVRLNWYFIK